METQTRLSRYDKFISAENIIAIFSVSSYDSLHASLLSQSSEGIEYYIYKANYIYIYIYIYTRIIK